MSVCLSVCLLLTLPKRNQKIDGDPHNPGIVLDLPNSSMDITLQYNWRQRLLIILFAGIYKVISKYSTLLIS